MKKVLVTGCAGFIGFHYSVYLLRKNYKVLGIDNLNNYYDVNLKKNRLKILKKYKNFHFFKIDLTKKYPVENFFKKNSLNYIVHLAAQAGVRYSLINPYSYMENNVIAYLNILECLKNKKKNIKIIYASSSSVYGKGNGLLNEYNDTNKPIQLYAVSKKTNELMSEAYKSLFNMNFVGIRFFTVYGPWGRPDMALYKFTKNIINNKYISVFNKGEHTRNFTYIDDAVKILYLIMKKKINTGHEIFNIASPYNYTLKNYIFYIEQSLNKKSKKKLFNLQKGDIPFIKANIRKTIKFTKFNSFTKISEGIPKFISWYKKYNKIKNND